MTVTVSDAVWRPICVFGKCMPVWPQLMPLKWKIKYCWCQSQKTLLHISNTVDPCRLNTEATVKHIWQNKFIGFPKKKFITVWIVQLVPEFVFNHLFTVTFPFHWADDMAGIWSNTWGFFKLEICIKWSLNKAFSGNGHYKIGANLKHMLTRKIQPGCSFSLQEERSPAT